MGDKPLRKVLSYRDQSGQTLETHTEHWRGFTWEAGPIVVTHQGAAWGRVQVWAATAEEGKRVVRHAAEVSGVDPDADGEWYIHSSTASRYGKSGTMAPKPMGKGAISVTMRAGSAGLPEYVVPTPDL
jgi:hypothetical protein